jgi:tetratricopeptide (TPR) repeat protein
LWERREQLARQSESAREDNLEFAVLWADLRARLTDDGARREALAILSEAESQEGASPVLEFERRRNAAAAGESPSTGDLEPRTPWEHWALGRALLSAGLVKEARERLLAALELAPDAPWPRFYLAHAAHRLGRFDEALLAAEVCVALAPRRAECLNLRGTTRAALAQWEAARRDFTRALDLDPEFGLAAFNRAIANQELGYPRQALADLDYAVAHGISREAARPHAALVEGKLGER